MFIEKYDWTKKVLRLLIVHSGVAVWKGEKTEGRPKGENREETERQPPDSLNKAEKIESSQQREKHKEPGR